MLEREVLSEEHFTLFYSLINERNNLVRDNMSLVNLLVAEKSKAQLQKVIPDATVDNHPALDFLAQRMHGVHKELLNKIIEEE